MAGNTRANELQALLEAGETTDENLAEFFKEQAAGLSRVPKDHDNFRSIPTSWMRGISDYLVRTGRPLPAIDNVINPKKTRQMVSRALIVAINDKLEAPIPE